MKLYSIAQWNSGKFTAGVITGKIIFKSESLILQDIKFTPYSDISHKNQILIKDINNYLTINQWFIKRFDDIFGPVLPSSKIYNLGTNEIPYSIDSISDSIRFEINARKIWVCVSTSQLGVWYDRRFERKNSNNPGV